MADILVDRESHENKNQNLTKENITIKRATQVRGKLEKNDLQWNTYKVIKFNLQRFIQSKWLCKCLRPEGRQKSVLTGYDKMRKDLSVVNQGVLEAKLAHRTCKKRFYQS